MSKYALIVLLDIGAILIALLGYVGWHISNRMTRAFLATIAHLKDEIAHQPQGDHYYCPGCGHDCASAAACVRNAYGHQREGDLGKPCRSCVAIDVAEQMRAWLAQRESEEVNSERIV